MNKYFDILTKRMDDLDFKIMKLLKMKKVRVVKILIKNLSMEMELLEERMDILENIEKKID